MLCSEDKVTVVNGILSFSFLLFFFLKNVVGNILCLNTVKQDLNHEQAFGHYLDTNNPNTSRYFQIYHF